MYKRDGLVGGHVIMLGASEANTNAVRDALEAFPGGLQVGGGITADNCQFFVAKGASHVIVTSYVFRDGQIDFDRLDTLRKRIGKQKFVLDLNCRQSVKDNNFYVMTDRWQTFTTTSLDYVTSQLYLRVSHDVYLKMIANRWTHYFKTKDIKKLRGAARSQVAARSKHQKSKDDKIPAEHELARAFLCVFKQEKTILEMLTLQRSWTLRRLDYRAHKPSVN
ncbi:hypothetical protein PsorP6_015083 [Peronosclerospora sorghi]|uniref:Uncharacterized protein n=1 Tax=Peronosclerospora sorghi TaxID=230839 RepID=A0ACC0VTI4_9STRA|nr:hypothetical protein PsorP6_015083 [Peronosclerospora sorghi]